MLGFSFDFGYINFRISCSEPALDRLCSLFDVVLDMVMPL